MKIIHRIIGSAALAFCKLTQKPLSKIAALAAAERDCRLPDNVQRMMERIRRPDKK